jgi:hypothetical protein
VRFLVKDPGCSSQISDPGSRFFHPGSQIWIPDPGVQKAPDPQHSKNTNFFQNGFKEKIKPETTNFNLKKLISTTPPPPPHRFSKKPKWVLATICVFFLNVYWWALGWRTQWLEVKKIQSGDTKQTDLCSLLYYFV